MSKDEVRKNLNQDIPRSAIETRDSGFGKPLSYLSGWYVINRLNQVFGQGNWSYQVNSLNKVFEGVVNTKQYVSYVSTVTLQYRLTEQDAWVALNDVGFGDGQDKTNPGKAHELATKEAVTDGLKRCAKSLGMSMGLALYDKEQTYVSDEFKEESKPTVEVSQSRPTSSGNRSVNEENTKRAITAQNITLSTGSANIKTLKSSIKAAAKILDSKKTLPLAEFKSKYSVSKVDDLTDVDTLAIYAKVKVDYPELKL